MTAPIFDKDVPIISRPYVNDKDRTAPRRDPPGKDFKKLLHDQEKPKESKKRPFNDVAEDYKKASQKEVASDSELEDYSASETPTGYPTEAQQDNLSANESAEDAYAKSFFGEDELVKQDSLSATSESPAESLPPNADIVSLLTKRHDSLEKKSNVSLFDLQAQAKSPKSSEQAMAHQSSLAKENKTTAEQTLAAKEGQAVTFTSEDPSLKKIKTGLEAALEAKRRQGASADENIANPKIERKNPRLPTQEGDKNSAAFLAAQSAAGEQPKLTGTAATSGPVSVNQDARIEELEKIIANLYTVSVDGATDTSFEITDPNSVFLGAKITLSVVDDKPDQFSVTIEHLSVLAKSIVEMHGHQESLRSAFEQKGLTLHNIYATTEKLPDNVLKLAKSDESTRDQRGDEGNQQDKKQKRQQQS